MTMAELFPRTSAAYPDVADWAGEFEWSVFASRHIAINLIDHQLREYEAGGVVAMDAYCDCVAADVGAMASDELDDGRAQNVDAFRLLFALRPMSLTLSLGRSGDTYGWIMWSIARGATRGDRVFNFVPRLIPRGWLASPDYQEMVIEQLGGWTHSFYLCARRFGGLDNVARMFADLCFTICSDQFRRGLNQEENFSALVSMANWASNADEPQAEEYVHFVSGHWPGPLSDRNRAEVATLMITRAHRFSERDVQWWANMVLDGWRHLLFEHLEVQFLAASLRTMEDWREKRAEILAAITRLSRFYLDGHDPQRSAQQALESRVSILHPLIFFLSEHGTSTDVLDVLGAWYVSSGHRECDADVLVVAAGHPPGAKYLWQGGSLQIDEGGGADSYNRVLETGSNALREYYRATDLGDQPVGFDLNRRGVPDEEAAGPFEDAVRAHYRPDLLAAALPAGARFRSVLTIPATPVPISAMLANEAGVCAAGEASLSQPLPPRPIRRLSVWSADMMHGQFEVEALERCAQLGGWDFAVRGRDDEGPEAFREFYSDPEADVLWVIGHGEHSPYRMDHTGLHLGGDRLVTAAEISELAVPGGGSRLLVLNVCSGASTQLHGGIARMGLSQELVSPTQQVVAHLWPIGIYAGLAFGATLGAELVRTDRVSAYCSTVAALRDPEHLRAELRQRLGEDLGIHARLEHQDAQIGNVLSWGAPVLLS